MIKTVLAFDYGLRNIGVACGQSLTGTAAPLPIIRARDGVPRWETVEALIKEWQPSLLLVGLPLNMNGSDSEFGKRAKKFGRRLEGRFGLAVRFMDERLSSFAVKQNARENGHKGDYKKTPVDSLAAQMILEDWFRQNNG